MAVFIVIAYHAGITPGIPGGLGVTLFFVLSGFLITWLLLREYDKSSTISIRTFYVRRTLRIFPAYYVFVVFSLAVDFARGHKWTAGLIAAAFTYLVNYYNAFQGHPDTSVAHAWSLGVEEQFYLLWPVIFLLLINHSRKVAMWTVALVILAVTAWRSWLALSYHAAHSYLYNAFDTRCDALAIGCFIALAANQMWFQSFERTVRRSALFPLLTLALLFVSARFGSSAYHYSIGLGVDAALLALLVLQLIGLSSSPLWSWLDYPAVRWLGMVSYPSYLYHAWGLDAGRKILPHASFALAFAAGYSVTLLLAWMSYSIVERPFLAIKNRIAPPVSAGSEMSILPRV